MSIRDGVNCDIVSISVDGSYTDLGCHKGINFLVTPKNPTVDLTETYNYEHYSVDANDDKDQNYQLSTTDDK